MCESPQRLRNAPTSKRFIAGMPTAPRINLSPATDVSVGTGLLRFDGNGNFISATNDEIAIERIGLPSVSPLQFKLDFGLVSGLATQEAIAGRDASGRKRAGRAEQLRRR